MTYSVLIETAEGFESFEFMKKSHAARVYQIMCREERLHPTGVQRIYFKEGETVALFHSFS